MYLSEEKREKIKSKWAYLTQTIITNRIEEYAGR